MPLVAPKEITFNAYQEEDGGYYAVAEGYTIVTQGDDWDELKYMVHYSNVAHRMFISPAVDNPQLIYRVYYNARQSSLEEE